MKTVYIKLTNNCQLRCRHCYNAECKDSEAVMSEDTLILVRNFIIHQLIPSTADDEIIMIVFHGGEPMLHEMSELLNFIYSIKYVKFAVPSNFPSDRIRITATTNLVYKISPYILNVLGLFDPDEGSNKPMLSTSWDYKIRFANERQELQFESNFRYLVNNHFDVRPIVTVTRPLIENMTPSQVLEYFSDLGATAMNFERLTTTGRAAEHERELRPTNKDMSDWLYEAYIANRDKYHLTIPLFSSLEDSVKNGRLTGCRARQCSKDVITINPDGSVSACPNIANKVYMNLEYSKLGTNLEEVRGPSLMFQAICNKEALRDNNCYTCEYFKYCNGDCFQLESDETGCPGLKKVIQEIIDNV